MFSIGEFSKMTGLTVKTLRFYHESGILNPSRVEFGSGYRFYAEEKIETARVIAALRELEFSITDIQEILSNHDDDADIVALLHIRRNEIAERMRNDRRIAGLLDRIVLHESEANAKMQNTNFEVEEKTIEPMLVASMRMVGKYSDCGQGFMKIGRKFGRYICGKSMMLHHDAEFLQDDANFEAAIPVKKGESVAGIDVRELPGGCCITLMHLGKYDEIGRSYEELFKYARSKNLKWDLPTREVYHKGPGMIFRGNPDKYLTEIQLMLLG